MPVNTYRYKGESKTEKDGSKAAVPIPAPLALNFAGAFIDVSITQPKIVQEKLKREGKTNKIVAVRAMIDTGASNSVITPRVADELGLVHTGFRKVSSVQDEQDRPVYYGFIILPWGGGKEIPLVACPLKRFDCLIGRDILLHWHFTYNGPDGSITICD